MSATPATGLRGLARRHPIALYLGIVFGIGYPLMLIPVLMDHGILPGASLPARVGLDLERAAALSMVVLALFPAAVIVSGLEGGRPAVAALFRRMVKWRVGIGWWLVAVVGLPLVTVILALLMGDTLKPFTVANLLDELGGLAAGFLLVNLWEESSWAGFMQTRLERRHNLYLAALLTAIPFAAIHMPLQLLGKIPSPSALLIHFLLLTVLGIVVRSYFGLLLRGAANSLLIVGLAHTMFNRSNNTDGIAAKLLEGGHRQLAALLATLVLAIGLGVLMRRRSGLAERARLDRESGEPIPA